MSKAKPSFLKNIKPVTALNDYILDAPMAEGWVAIHKWLVENRDDLTREDYGALLLEELKRARPRTPIVARLKAMFDRERKIEEERELFRLIGGE